MGLLKPLTPGGYLKAGFFGFAGSGKTYSATLLAAGTRKFYDLKGPVAFFDTEGGSTYLYDRIKEATGLEPVGLKSRALKDLIAVGKEAEKEGISVLVVDSITHVWRELQDSYLARLNEKQAEMNRKVYTRLEFHHWMPIKRMWSEWADFYLNSNLHIIICGRAGFEYDYEKDEQSGKKELVKTGTKMKVEGEFGFEPSLLVEMERLEDGQGKTIRRATVVKDRFNVIDGKYADNPGFGFFAPHLEKLNPANHTPIDTTLKSSAEIDHEGHDEAARRSKQRKILIEEIEGELAKKWPSTGAKDKASRLEVMEHVFGTRSETKLEILDLDTLKGGLSKIRSIVNEQPSVEGAVENVTQ